MKADRRARAWSEVRRGTIQLGSLVIAAAAIFFMDQARLAIESGATLMLVAREAGELRPGGNVWLAGKQAGKVTDIRFIEVGGPEDPNLEIRAVLNREAAATLRRDATATIQPSGLLAPFVINLEPGSSGQPPYEFSDTLRAEVSLTVRALAALGDSLKRVVDELRPVAARLTGDMRSGRGTLAALGTGTGEFGELRASLEELGELADRPGSLWRLAADTALAFKLKSSGAQLDTLSAKLEESDARGRMLSSFRRLVETLEAVAERLDSAQGTAGRALHDREIQAQAHLLQARADSIRVELARRPFSWLRIRLF